MKYNDAAFKAELERRAREDRWLDAIGWLTRPLLVGTVALWCYLLVKIVGQMF